MQEKRFYIEADIMIHQAINSIRPEHWGITVPDGLARGKRRTVRDVVQDQAYDEAWVPDVLAGKTIEEVGQCHSGDLLGDDPVGNYNRIYEAATKATAATTDVSAMVHLTYGDVSVATYFEHITAYRALQAWAIGQLVGSPVTLSDEMVDYLWEKIMPTVEQMRQWGVFAQEVLVPSSADRCTQLLAKTGYWLGSSRS